MTVQNIHNNHQIVSQQMINTPFPGNRAPVVSQHGRASERQ